MIHLVGLCRLFGSKWLEGQHLKRNLVEKPRLGNATTRRDQKSMRAREVTMLEFRARSL